MKTATNTRPASTAEIDFDLRLQLTGIGMDVLLSGAGGRALEEAHAAAAEAVTAASIVQPCPDVTYASNPILKRAGDIIRERGWARGDWVDATGAVCALEAVSIASRGVPGGYSDATAELMHRIRRDTGQDGWSVPGWNDSRKGREEVLRVLF